MRRSAPTSRRPRPISTGFASRCTPTGRSTSSSPSRSPPAAATSPAVRPICTRCWSTMSKFTPKSFAADFSQLFTGVQIQCAECHNHPFDRWTMDDYYGFVSLFTGIRRKPGAETREYYIYQRRFGPAGQEHCRRPARAADASWAAKSPCRRESTRAPSWPAGSPRPTTNCSRGTWPIASGPITWAADWSNRSTTCGSATRRRTSRCWMPWPSTSSIRASTCGALVRDICTSRVYQLSSKPNATNALDDRQFSRCRLRRLRADVLLDSIVQVTGSERGFPDFPPGTKAIQFYPRSGGSTERAARRRSVLRHLRPLVASVDLLVRNQARAHLVASLAPDGRRHGPGPHQLRRASAICWRRSSRPRRSSRNSTFGLSRAEPTEEAFGHDGAGGQGREEPPGLRRHFLELAELDRVHLQPLIDRRVIDTHRSRLVCSPARSSGRRFAQAEDKPAVTYDEQIKPIFRQHCWKCHGEDEQKADINLAAFGSIVKGGSGGKIVVPGRASASLLYQVITHEDPDVRMPPNSPPLPAAQIELIRVWIQDGLRESSGSQSLATARDLNFKPSRPARLPLPAARRRCPAKLPDVALAKTIRPLPVLALAASPTAPVAAVAGQEHIRLDRSGDASNARQPAVSRRRAACAAFQPRRQGIAGRRRAAGAVGRGGALRRRQRPAIGHDRRRDRRGAGRRSEPRPAARGARRLAARWSRFIRRSTAR